jgi:hypothetical protein
MTLPTRELMRRWPTTRSYDPQESRTCSDEPRSLRARTTFISQGTRAPLRSDHADVFDHRGAWPVFAATRLDCTNPLTASCRSVGTLGRALRLLGYDDVSWDEVSAVE